MDASFARLLREHRLALGLTQEELAARGGLSARAVSDIERGLKQAPRASTVRLLVRGLGLLDDEAAAMFHAAQPARGVLRRPAPGEEIAAARRQEGVSGQSAHNLPIPTTSYVPRAGEIARVKQRLLDGRLVTITGSGGCGKTRLATEVAAELVHQFSDGAWLVDLALIGDASLVSATIAAAVGLRDVPGRPLTEVLTEYLRRRHLLIILDNCEHLIEACADIVDRLLHSCADVHVLATSRELLGVAGEATWRVPPLSFVDAQTLASPGEKLVAQLTEFEAIRLFVDRARLAVPEFDLSEDDARAVAQVCQRLDGIPLAIELAASRLALLSVEQVASRLDQRFRLLTGGHRTAVRRQQTLRATIDWSHDLLSEEEQALFRRLAVFAGGWSLERSRARYGAIVHSARRTVAARPTSFSCELGRRRARVRRPTRSLLRHCSDLVGVVARAESTSGASCRYLEIQAHRSVRSGAGSFT